MTARWLAVALLVLTACHPHPKRSESPEEVAHKATVVLGLTEGSTCSGTYIAPTVILSAAHCFDSNDLLTVNNEPVNVESIKTDANDHAWVTVDRPSEHVAPMGQPPKVGDEVFMYGNPGPLRDVFRRGYVVSIDGLLTFYDMPISFGDSGSAVFNEAGEVVAVVSAFRLLPSGAAFAASFEIGEGT